MPSTVIRFHKINILVHLLYELFLSSVSNNKYLLFRFIASFKRKLRVSRSGKENVLSQRGVELFFLPRLRLTNVQLIRINTGEVALGPSDG